MLKIICSIVVFLFCGIHGYAQMVLPTFPPKTFSTYYDQKVSHFDTFPQRKEQIIFIGNSITDGAQWASIFDDVSILNMGISGDVSAGIINRLPQLVKFQPTKVFLMVGINDFANGVSVDSVIQNIRIIANYIKQENPSTSLFIQSLLPVNDSFDTFKKHTKMTKSILTLNRWIANHATELDYTFVNIHDFFVNKEGRLNTDFTNDGLHLMGAGYALWKHLIYAHVYGLQKEASIIPKPTQILKGTDFFPLYKVKTIVYNADSIKNEALKLRDVLAELGIQAKLVLNENSISEPHIRLAVSSELSSKNAESYHLKVDKDQTLIRASSAAGIFYGVQTLKQLSRDGYFINAVDIKDEPAFGWRGYLVDVGRNYQSIPLLKKQIDVMSAYKLNVFHMHLTEDIAWRLASKKFPELTNAEHMLRNKGMYYTEGEIKDLIAYCNERHILFLPEIDMPGHSAAFKRATKFDMQSDSGLLIVKEILKEFFETYDLPYLHIGADEVKITNKNFLPEISKFIRTYDKKIIGWEPGGNFDDDIIRQLWMEDEGLTGGQEKVKFIDSRHLYVNHMDPLESVVTIFNRQLCDVNVGNSQAMGATLCLWPDRAVAKEEDAISMNAVYPAMLAFAERSWLGNGYVGWISNMDLHGLEAKQSFVDFEERLLDHKKEYFSGLSFPYQKQSDITWKLYGPYDNGGDLSKKFEPEATNFDFENIAAVQTTTGGTIILRHWWAPKIQSVLPEPKENTTWYAFRRIWADQDTTKNFWIGFYNISRSQSSNSPKAATWDNRESQIWLNDELIPAPKWMRANQSGNLEIPLIDESYEYRAPAQLRLKKGWNTVRIKAPVGSFNGENWNNPVKWMFTFVEAEL